MLYLLKFNAIARNANRTRSTPTHTHARARMQFCRLIYSVTQNISFAVRISCIQIPSRAALALKFWHIYSIEWKYFLVHQKTTSATFRQHAKPYVNVR